MRWFVFFIILLIATLLEAGNLLKLFAVGGRYIGPSILITLLVYYALACRTKDAIICSFLIGFAADIIAGPMGPHTVCFGLIGLLLNQANQVLLVQRAVFKALVVFVVYLIAETLSYWLGFFKEHNVQNNYYTIMFFVGIYSAVISPILWSILAALSGWANIKKTRASRVYH
ncbi:MAG: rod shape-determining protein MreD [Planctomycetota bacterium]